MEHAFTWVSIIPGLSALPDHTATATLVALALIAWALVALKQMRAAADPVVPDATLTARNLLEIYVELFTDLVEGVIGHNQGRKYMHMYAALFLFILAANLLGLVPGFAPPTNNFNITFALGVVSFVVYNYYGFAAKGPGYLKHFLGPFWWLVFLMLPLELVDNFVRPFSLSLRLFGNMTGDHLVLEIFTDLTKMIIPVVFYLLGILVCVIQAFVFTLLSIIYVQLAVAHHEEY